MDPKANMRTQVDLANAILGVRESERGVTDRERIENEERGARLAEAVIDGHYWRSNGGFDPYARPDESTPEQVVALAEAILVTDGGLAIAQSHGTPERGAEHRAAMESMSRDGVKLATLVVDGAGLRARVVISMSQLREALRVAETMDDALSTVEDTDGAQVHLIDRNHEGLLGIELFSTGSGRCVQAFTVDYGQGPGESGVAQEVRR